jgi:hypothetical protein
LIELLDSPLGRATSPDGAARWLGTASAISGDIDADVRVLIDVGIVVLHDGHVEVAAIDVVVDIRIIVLVDLAALPDIDINL